MKTVYYTSYSDDSNQSSKEIQDIVNRVSDSVSVMLERQLSSKKQDYTETIEFTWFLNPAALQP